MSIRPGERILVLTSLCTNRNFSINIDDSGSLTVSLLRSRARRRKARSGLDLVVVDYLQLMALGQPVGSREKEISEISRSLKHLAKELDVPVIALSQLNRNVETRTDKRPTLADLRESGAIEQDADVVLLLYRDEVYDAQSPHKGIAEILTRKQRNDPTGERQLLFIEESASNTTTPLPMPWPISGDPTK